MCLRFVFLLITRMASWLRLSRHEQAWQSAEILILRYQLAVLQRRQPRRPNLNWADRALLATLLGPSENPYNGATTMTDLLAGKTILITGASSGIGKSAALLFAREGANVVITARRKPELERVAEDIAADGGNVLAVQADTTSAEEMQRASRPRSRSGGASTAL